jgi:hypothetical protein
MTGGLLVATAKRAANPACLLTESPPGLFATQNSGKVNWNGFLICGATIHGFDVIAPLLK